MVFFDRYVACARLFFKDADSDYGKQRRRNRRMLYGTACIYICIRGFLPPAFLPVWMEQAGSRFFYRGWMEKTGMFLQGRIGSGAVLELIVQLVLFLIVGVLAAKVRKAAEK